MLFKHQKVRQLSAVFICLILLTFLTVPVFAKDVLFEDYPVLVSRFVSKKDGQHHVTVNGNAMNKEQQEIWKQIMSDATKSDRVVLYAFANVNGPTPYFMVASFDRSSVKCEVLNIDSFTMPRFTSDSIRWVWFQSSNFSTSFDLFYSASSSSDHFDFGTIYHLVMWNPDREFTLDSRIDEFSDIAVLAITDGLDDEPEEPSSSSSTEEPDIPSSSVPVYVPPAPPTISGGDLPFDVTIWNDIVAYIRTAAGSIGHILILTMFLLAAIPILISVIRHYISQGKSGGNGGGLI